MEEAPLRGTINAVRRVGDTVRRSAGPWTPAVHALLRCLERANFDGAPRVLGIDDEGCEVLTFVEGDVAPAASPAAVPDSVLIEAGRLLRRLHDATEGFALPPGVRWHHRGFVSGASRVVVCHNDVAPRNTVFRAGHPVAFIDWDGACPASAVWDVAHAAWQFVPLTDDAGCARRGWNPMPDRPTRLRVLCDAYGLAPLERAEFVDVTVRRMSATADGIESYAAAGAPAFAKLVAAGIPGQIRSESAWVGNHAAALRDALR